MSTNTATTTPEIQDAAAAIASRLETAWNAADDAGFAAEFTPDADFVNIRGDYSSGRDAIGHGHRHILSTIYAGSTIQYSVTQVRQLAPTVAIAHLDAQLQVPGGPLAGELRALPSMILVLEAGKWQIAAFHNTQRQQG